MLARHDALPISICIVTAGQPDTQIIVCAGDWIDRIGRDFRNAALFDVIAPGEVKVQCIGDVILDARKGCEALRIIPLFAKRDSWLRRRGAVDLSPCGRKKTLRVRIELAGQEAAIIKVIATDLPTQSTLTARSQADFL